MRKLIALVAMFAVAATVRVVMGQGRSDQQHPFYDRSDNGEIVHVLPPHANIRAQHDTQPINAPAHQGTAVFPASYGSGNLLDHGGGQMENATFAAIFWNSSVANSTATSLGYSNVSQQIVAFINSFSSNGNWSNASTDDFKIVQQYGSSSTISPSIPLSALVVDSQPSTGSMSDAKVRNYLAGLLNAGRVVASESTLYGIYFPPGLKITMQGGASCSSFCGYHGNFNWNGMDIKYAVFPYLNCSACSLSGKSVADMLTIVTSHEIREAVTDPDLNSWYDRSGYEADDKCAWHNLYQMTNGGFWVQPEYSNGGTVTRSGFTATYPGPGCVVPNR